MRWLAPLAPICWSPLLVSLLWKKFTASVEPLTLMKFPLLMGFPWFAKFPVPTLFPLLTVPLRQAGKLVSGSWCGPCSWQMPLLSPGRRPVAAC